MGLTLRTNSLGIIEPPVTRTNYTTESAPLNPNGVHVVMQPIDPNTGVRTQIILTLPEGQAVGESITLKALNANQIDAANGILVRGSTVEGVQEDIQITENVTVRFVWSDIVLNGQPFGWIIT